MAGKAVRYTVSEIAKLGKDNIPPELLSGQGLVYSSPATLAYNSPGAEGFGVKRAGLAVPESVMLIVSPGCCGRNTSIVSSMPRYKDRFFYLMMDETDLVTGRHLKRIPDAVCEVVSYLDKQKGNKPKVVVASCYRRKNIANNFQECPGNADNVIEQHNFITTAAAIPQRKTTLTYGYYHHGRNTNYGLTELVAYPTFHPGSSSVIAEDWDPAIWDLSGAATDLPTLL